MTHDLEVSLRQVLTEDAASHPDLAGLQRWGRRRSLARRAFPVAAAAAVIAVAVGIGVGTHQGGSPAVQPPAPSATTSAPISTRPISTQPISTQPISTQPTATGPTPPLQQSTASAADKAEASDTMRRWIASVPVYPGATSAAGPQPTTPRIRLAIDGWFALGQSWAAPDDFQATVAWYRSHAAAAGFTGRGSIGDADQWQIAATAPAAYRQTLYAGTLTLTINDTGSSTAVALEADGAAVPARDATSLIPADQIISGSMSVTPIGEPATSQRPACAGTVILNVDQRSGLMAMLNDAPVQPTGTGSGFPSGYSFEVTFGTANAANYNVSYSSQFPLRGPVLELPDHRTVVLDPGPAFLQMLTGMCTVSAPSAGSPATNAPASTTVPPSSTDAKAAASTVLQRWITAAPRYPGSTPTTVTDSQPALGTPMVDGWFTEARAWSTSADLQTVQAWYRSRVTMTGSETRSPSDGTVRWQISIASHASDAAAVTDGRLSLIMSSASGMTVINVVAGGAPIPERAAGTRIPTGEVLNASITVKPASSVPAGWKPQAVETVDVSPADTARLIEMLNSAPIQAPASAGGLEYGFDFVVTFRTADGTEYLAHYNSQTPSYGPSLSSGADAGMTLNTDPSFATLLYTLCGVKTP